MACLLRTLVVVIVAVIGLLPGSAAALTVEVTGGSLSSIVRNDFDAIYSLSGENFSLTHTLRLTWFGGQHSPYPSPGFPADISGFLQLPRVGFTNSRLVFGGVEYFARSEFQITVPPFLTFGPGSISLPFSFTGRVLGFLRCLPGSCLNPDIELSLTGGGIASAVFRDNSPGHVEIFSEFYRFAPVPEPSTWVLMATGLVAVGWTWRARRKFSAEPR